MKGLGVSPGIGIGKVFLYRQAKIIILRENIESVEKELERFDGAADQAKSEIENLYKISLDKFGEKDSEIFLAHKMMLEDPEYMGEIKKKIYREKVNAEWAVNEITNGFLSLFENIKDEYLKLRAIDLKDVSKRLLRILLQIESVDLLAVDRDTIIIAEDLTPSDISQMNKENIQGLVTELGGKNSHTFIMARSIDMPAIIGVRHALNLANNGDPIIIDGTTGHIILNPNEEEMNLYIKKQKEVQEFKTRMKDMIGKKSISKDNHRVKITGNIGNPRDIDKVLENDGEGAGLFRTEFLYMDSDKLPTEEEQFRAYKTVAEKLEDKPLVIRTVDIGGDKEVSYLNLRKEMNPFLGYRGIRLCLDRVDIFKTQLRAILRASHYGNIKIMFPMISSIEELRKSKIILEEVKEELESEHISFKDDLEIGIMVEVPAVAIHSRAFAEEVDFFSIGTNDLIQYTLAVDRGNEKISGLYNQYDPAVLRLIKMTIDNGHEAGIWVGMCGELAGDQKLIPILLAMGLDEFSVRASSILESRYLISNISKVKSEEKLDELLNLSTAKDIEDFLK